MSHFAVAVITEGYDTVEELLEPYMENCCGTPDRKYMEFYDVEEEYAKEYENGTVSKVRCPDGSIASKWDKRFKVDERDEMGFMHERYEYPDGYEVVDIPCKEAYPTLGEYLEGWHGYSIDEETGRYGYWQNPNAKWDWYDDNGGRFRQYAIDLMGDQSLPIEDIKFDAAEHMARAEKWWQKNMDEEGKPIGFAAFEWDGLDHDRYVKSRGHLSFRAVVTPDGEWHEVGEMGWWGCSTENADETYEWRLHFEERFLEPYQDYWLTIVDCHI